MIEFKKDKGTDRVRIMRDGNWIDSLVKLVGTTKWVLYGRAQNLTTSEKEAINDKLTELNN